jgi:AcrR family transcriptional regulator
VKRDAPLLGIVRRGCAMKALEKPRGRPRSFDRDKALERAMQVFWRQGYEATSVSDLTRAMGINPPSLYAAFGDKERLYLDALERYQRSRLAAVAKWFGEEPTAKAAVARLLREA